MATKKSSGKQVNIRILVVILVLMSVVFVGGRMWLTGKNTFPEGDSLWLVSVNIEVNNDNLVLAMRIPFFTGSDRVEVVRQSMLHPKVQIRRQKGKRMEYAELLASSDKKGLLKLNIEYLLRVSDSHRIKLRATPEKLDPEYLQNQLAQDLPIKASADWVKKNVARLNGLAKDKSDYINKATGYVHRLTTMKHGGKKIHLNSYDRALLLATLCRMNNIPTRVVAGVILKEEINAAIHYWVQTWDGKKWLGSDPSGGYVYKVPRNYLLLRPDHRDFAQVNANQKHSVSIDISEEHDVSGLISTEHQGFVRVFDLTRLSRDLQEDLTRLLLLPYAILLTAFIRMMVGIRCYGTFTPSLLAFSLLYLPWLVALYLFTFVTVVAFFGLRFMPGDMSRVPRLSIVFILVAFGLGYGLSLLDYTDLTVVGQSVLLPIVVLTSLIDRLYSTWELNGRRIAMIRLHWTFVITVLCVPVVTFKWLGYQTLKYPEIHFITIAIILMMYSYTGKHMKRYLPIPWLLEKETEKTGKSKKQGTSEEKNAS